jgi:enoyl-CoA hydratase/carnithine racemase
MSGFQRRFEDYADRYDNITLERSDGILEIRVHTEGKSLVWSALAHHELGDCFQQVSADRENKAVILTGTGENFCVDINAGSFEFGTPSDWDVTIYDGKRLLMNLLNIEVPVIGAINGPARIHPELPILSNVVIAADTAVLQDAPHYMSGVVPGDGAQLAWPYVLGPVRGSHFLLTGQEIDAATARDWGAVNEVVPRDQVLGRAREIARTLATQPFLVRRYTRNLLVQPIKRILLDELGAGLAHAALAGLDEWPEDGAMSR